MAQVDVDDSVTTLVTGPFQGWVRNAGSNSVFLGRGEDVTTSNGYELAAGDALAVHVKPTGRLTAIAAASGERVDTLDA